MAVKMLLIDNYDSFTFNLVQAFRVLGAEVDVYRNDEIDLDAARALGPTHLVVSPGPGRPDDAGCSQALIAAFAPDIPVLGVCLGHQCIVQVFGGRIGAADRLMHGKSSEVEHDGLGVFAGLPSPFVAGRYHSLSAERDAVPDTLVVTAHSDDGEIMAVRHRELRVEGVQFHPESVLTPLGNDLLANFITDETTP